MRRHRDAAVLFIKKQKGWDAGDRLDYINRVCGCTERPCIVQHRNNSAGGAAVTALPRTLILARDGGLLCLRLRKNTTCQPYRLLRDPFRIPV